MAETLTISDIGRIAISLSVAIIVVAVMSLIIVDFQGETPDNTASFGNQTLTWAGNNTVIGFTESRVVASSVILYNNGTVVSSNGNYSATSSGITITNVSPTNEPEWVTSDLNASYDYKIGSAAFNATNSGLEAQTTFSSFFPIIALTAVGAIVVGVVLTFFLRRRND